MLNSLSCCIASELQMSQTHLNCLVKVLHDCFPVTHHMDFENIATEFFNRHNQPIHSAQHIIDAFWVTGHTF